MLFNFRSSTWMKVVAFIQSLELSEVLYISYSDFQKLLDGIPGILHETLSRLKSKK